MSNQSSPISLPQVVAQSPRSPRLHFSSNDSKYPGAPQPAVSPAPQEERTPGKSRQKPHYLINNAVSAAPQPNIPPPHFAAGPAEKGYPRPPSTPKIPTREET